jgi:pimeloyl-ACP methyl ester carboxylesterase
MARMTHIAVRLGSEWRTHAQPGWIEHWTPRRFGLRGGTTELVEVGSGPPLVLVPPLPGFKEVFVACVPLLAASFRVVTFDQRWIFPGVKDPERRWGMLVEDAERVCDALRLDRVGVLGHSLGGALAQRWALAHPGRVAALVLSSSFAHVRTPAGGRRARFLEQPLVLALQRLLPRALALAHARRLARDRGWVYDPACDSAILDLVRRAIRACPVRAAASCVRLALAHDTRNSLADIVAPTRLVVGQYDTAFARDAARELERGIRGTTIVESEGAGHLHPLSAPARLAEIVEDWMRPRLG